MAMAMVAINALRLALSALPLPWTSRAERNVASTLQGTNHRVKVMVFRKESWKESDANRFWKFSRPTKRILSPEARTWKTLSRIVAKNGA